MNKIYLLLIIVCVSISDSFSQDRYVVRFKDKNNSPYSVNNPQQFLSQRSITRRNNQNIAITANDLPVNPAYIQGVKNAGATVLNVSKWLNCAIIQTSDPLVISAINNLSYVNSLTSAGRPIKSTLPKFAEEKFLPPSALRTSSFNYGQAFTQTNMIGINSLHDNGFAGEGIIIAVLDGGFQDANLMPCFDSLFMQNRVISTWDFVSGDSNVYDDNYHGSSVLSCMAANVPGEMVGTAPHAKYILLRSEDVNSEYIIEEYNWAAAAEYADSAGADVINTSLGYFEFDDPAQNHTYADMNGNICPSSIAADFAAKKGILVCASAGNEGDHPWNFIGTPADADSVLTVGAVDGNGLYASFSSNGPSADGRVKPDVADVGLGSSLYTPWVPTATFGNGTSFSSPIMAGAAACLWQAWPQMNNMQILNAIQRSASQYSNPDTLIGYGIPNFALAFNLLSLNEYTIPDDEQLHVFPNPWNGIEPLHVLFFSDSSSEITLTVTDMAGKTLVKKNQKVMSGVYNTLEVNDFFSGGMYILKIKSTKADFVKRFVRK